MGRIASLLKLLKYASLTHYMIKNFELSRVGDGGAKIQVNIVMDPYAREEDLPDRTSPDNALINRPVNSSDDLNYSSLVMQTLYNSQNFEATFATLDKSITNNIRQNGDNHTVVNGKEGKYVILFRIRGWFLNSAVILIVGGAVFFGVVLHYTHRSRMEFWSTNALPIVAWGEKIGPIFNDNDMRVRSMEQNAKGQLVQFSIVPRRDFDRADTLNRSENRVMISSSRTSMTQIPSTDVENITSPSRASVIPSAPAELESAASPLRTSMIQSLSADVESIVSPLRNSGTQRPSSDVMSIVSDDA